MAGLLFMMRLVSSGITKRGRSGGSELALVALIIWGFVGSAIGRFGFGYNANALAFFAPLLILIVNLVSPVRLTTRVVLRGFAVVSAIYSLSAILVLIFNIQIAPDFQFRHQTAFFLVAGFGSALVLKARLLLLLHAVATATCFAQYPALTYILLLVVAVVCTAYVCAPHRLRLPFLYVIAAAGLMIILGRSQLDGLRMAYFSTVGKGDNSSTRETLFRIGVEKLRASPFWGNWFVENISVKAPDSITGGQVLVPLHDDYLQLSVAGGLVFTTIFTVVLLWICVRALHFSASTNRSPTWRIRNLYSLSTASKARYVCAMSVLAIMVDAMVNPILIEPGAALTLGVLLVAIFCLREKDDE
ncbi:hypothetical protein [Williamsia sp.]|uniref:hypothetical protein n=1 Tax=Williamsia sp. TaxID=1872085 RepID=UPI001A1F9352|nr:hypothetical protein [Williamsia sp.]MBJ7289903.1 hypothetical protein [Williamsia sp.]